MGESLYAVLGVGRGASEEAIERAYRERAKTWHPDVSEAPDARERFKRLTFARDTLTDADERSRYERLGHTVYVDEHAPEGLFEGEAAADTDATGGSSATGSSTAHAGGPGDAAGATTAPGSDTARTATDGSGAATWWEDGVETGTAAGTQASSAAGTGSVDATRQSVDPTGGSVDPATGVGEYYTRRTHVAERTTGPGLVWRLWSVLGALGGWIVVYLVLFGSAGTIGWIALSTTASASLGLLFLFGLTVTVLLAASLHLVTLLWV